LAFEERLDYVATSAFRFLKKDTGPDEIRSLHERILAGATVELDAVDPQMNLLLFRSAAGRA